MDSPLRPAQLLVALLATGAAGCSSSPEPAGAPASAGKPSYQTMLGATKVFAPTPYTAEQIRLSNRPGTRTVYRIVTGYGPPVVRTTWFVVDDGKNAHLESETVDADGNPLGEIVFRMELIEENRRRLEDQAETPGWD